MSNTIQMRILFAIIAFYSSYASIAGTIRLEGSYYNKNLYIKNSFAGSGAGFCVYEVRINGNVSTDEINSSAFEIDLVSYNLAHGDKVIVEIKYKDDCTPRVMNPEVLDATPSFETHLIKISEKGILSWVTDNETGSLNFIIEQFKWNKWIPVGEIKGKGTKGKHSYEYKAELVSGLNKFRVKQKGKAKLTRTSPETSILAPSRNISFKLNNASKEITFNLNTYFELYDIYGNITKRGFGNKIPLSNLQNGSYYLNFDNSTAIVEL